MGEFHKHFNTMSRTLAIFAVVCVALATAEVYFEEDFSGDWESRWTQSKAKSDLGTFKVSAGKFYGDAEASKGLQTSQDAKFYGIMAKHKEFSNDGKTLVVQFSVKHQQDIDCGGAYLKLTPTMDAEKFAGDSKYNIMFGPDICGSSTKKTHVIFNYKEKNLDKKKEVRAESDTLSHLYTLIVKPDNTYEVQIDMNKVDSGSLAEGWSFLEPKEIGDPKAKKPDDWDDESDGTWEAPQVDNPAFKGAWKAKRIKNPAYKGIWEAKLIANPKYVADDNLYSYKSFNAVGIDVWQVKSGTIFDNLLVTDDVEYAKAHGDKTWKAGKDAEKAAKDKADEEKRKKDEEERKKKEAEEKAKKDAEPKKEEEKKTEEKKEL